MMGSFISGNYKKNIYIATSSFLLGAIMTKNNIHYELVTQNYFSDEKFVGNNVT